MTKMTPTVDYPAINLENGLDKQPEGGGMYHDVVIIIMLIMLLSLLCCYSLLLVYSKYEKMNERNSKLNFSHFNRRLLKIFIYFES